MADVPNTNPVEIEKSEPTLAQLLSQAGPNEAPAMQSILELLDPICITQRTNGAVSGQYNPIIHGKLCRYKMLGLSIANCAKAVGITPQMLYSWLQQHEQLAIDMQQAEQLAVAEIVKLLMAAMNQPGPVGLNAIKFFLSSRTEEFREKRETEVRVVSPAEIRRVAAQMYGLDDDSPDEIEGELSDPVKELPAPDAFDDVL